MEEPDDESSLKSSSAGQIICLVIMIQKLLIYTEKLEISQMRILNIFTL